MRSEYFFGFILSFIAGVGFESLFNFGYPLGVLFLFLGATLLLLRNVKSVDKKSFLVSLMLVACALGVFRVDVQKMKQGVHTLDMFLQKTVMVQGVVSKEPDVREEYTNIVLEVQNVFYNNATTSSKNQAHILVRMPLYPDFEYGDVITISGKLIVPKNFSAQGDAKEFDYRSYLARSDIFYQMYFPKVYEVTQEQGNIVLQKLFLVKEKLLHNITRMIPEPEAALGGGILLGAKQSLGDELLQKFRETGVAHIVVLSGYNIAIVATALSSVLYFLPFTARIIVSVMGVVLFAVMVGGGATVVRATIMVLVVLIVRWMGREHDVLRALVLAGGLMILVNPMILLHDVSFQLSFVATLALVVLVPLIEKYFLFVSNKVLREILVTTVATQIFVLPLILYYMGSISLIGVIANIFILPVVPFAMLVVALVSVFGSVALLGSFLAAVSYGVLWYMIFTVEMFSRLPFAQVSDVAFPLWALVVMYVVMTILIIAKSKYIKVGPFVAP